MVTLSKLHPKNELPPIVVTLFGISNVVNPEHPSKAPESMLVTPLGMTALVKYASLEQAFSGMFVLPLSNMIVSTSLPLRQLPSQRVLMEVTFLGIVKLFSFVQPLNTLPPNDVKPCGNVILVKLLQFLNAYEPIDVTVYPPNIDGTITLDVLPVYFVIVAESFDTE